MAAQPYLLAFDGYWREPNKGGIPAESGIYCVFSCVHNVAEKTVTLNKLIYTGESDDVNARVANHEKLSDWQKHIKQGEVLCYGFSPVPSSYRIRCEAAMIFKHKPPENTEYTQAFPFDQTTLSLTGKTRLLYTSFTIQRQ